MNCEGSIKTSYQVFNKIATLLSYLRNNGDSVDPIYCFHAASPSSNRRFRVHMSLRPASISIGGAWGTFDAVAGTSKQAHLHQKLKLPLTTLPRCCHATTIDSARHITSHWPHKILRTSTTLHHSFAWPLSAVYTHRAISASHLNLADSLDVVSRVCRSSSRIEAPSLAAELRRDHRQRRAS